MEYRHVISRTLARHLGGVDLGHRHGISSGLVLQGISCVRCGVPLRHVPATEPGGEGNLADYLWLCGPHRQALASYIDQPKSPGRPSQGTREREHLAVRHAKSQRPRMPKIRTSAPSPPRPGMPDVTAWS